MKADTDFGPCTECESKEAVGKKWGCEFILNKRFPKKDARNISFYLIL